MARAFLKAVMAGTLASVAVPWLIVLLVVFVDQGRAGTSVAFIVVVITILTMLIVLTGALVIGLPVAIALRWARLESTTAYLVAGAVSGILFIWVLLSLLSASGGWLAALFFGPLGGGTTAYVWWRSTAHRESPPATVHMQLAQGTSKVRGAGLGPRDWTLVSWPPNWGRPGDIRIRPFNFFMTLGVLAMALVVAAAGAGRLDWLPSQTYFPASLRNAIPVHCTDADENKVEEMAPIDEFEAEWFSNELRAAGEPSLYLASQTPVGRSTETYRFTWLRSFHPKVTVRVDKTGTGAWRLDARRSSGGTEQSPARLKRILRPSEEADLERFLLKSRVLDLPPRDCRGGMDGSRWIIEANERGTYHFANRWTPEDGPVHDFGLLLLGFTGWDLNPIY